MSSRQLSFKIIARARRLVCIHFNVRAQVEQIAGDGITQGQIHRRAVGMRRPGARIVLVEGKRIYDKLSCALPVFLLAAAWVLLLRSCVIEIPQALLAGNRTMPIEHEEFGLERPE